MILIVLEIENDLVSILEIVQQLNIKHFTLKNSESFTNLEHNYRKAGLAKFKGILNTNNSYYPSKSEFYEQ